MRWIGPAMLLLGCATAPPAEPPTRQTFPGPCATTVEGDGDRVAIRYEYGPGRRLVREIETGKGRAVQRLWNYDEKGRRVRQVVVDNGKLHAIHYRYEAGLLVAIEQDATGTGDVVLRRTRTYDDAGHLVRRTTVGPQGETLAEHELHYGTDGRLAYVLERDPKGSRRVDIEIGPGGRIVGRRSADAYERFVFAATGRLDAMVVERGGEPHITRRYAYDDAGNLLRAATYDRQGRRLRLTRHSYACWTSSHS